MDLPEAYYRALRIAEDRVVILPCEEEIDVSAVPEGVVFVLAKWSVASQLSFRELNAALAEAPELSTLKLLIADTDCEATQRFMEELGDVPSGSGETYWIKGGVVLSRILARSKEQGQAMRQHARRVVGDMER
jgi:hypothetical protein